MVIGKLGLRGKTVLGLGVLLTGSLLVMGLATYRHGSDLVIMEILKIVRGDIEKDSREIIRNVVSAEHDLLVIADTPPILGIVRAREHGGIDPMTGDKAEFWRARMEQIFCAFLRNHLEYVKLRYIDEKGIEIVSAISDGKDVRAVTWAGMVDRAESPYFIQSIKLPKGKTYFSDVFLERGKDENIEVPHMPVMRLATPAYDAAGRARAVIVLTIKTDDIFAVISRDSTNKFTKYLINSDGFFLFSPDKSLLFGNELGNKHKLSDLHPDIFPEINGNDFFIKHERDERHIDGFIKIFFDPDHKDRYWTLVYATPDAVALKEIIATRNTMVIYGVLIIIISLALITWITSRYLLSPILALANAARKMEGGDLSVRLKEDSVGDELQLLYGAFNSAAEAQQHAVERFEKELAGRTMELEKLSRDMSLLLESTEDGIYVIDTQGHCTFINKAGAGMTGYSQEELIGRHMHDAIHYKRPDGSRYDVCDCPIYRAFQEQKGCRVDTEVFWRKDGGSLHVEYSSSPIIDNDVVKGSVITFRDISKRLAAEREMKKLSRAVEESVESVVVTDREGVIEYVNPAFERVSGYSSAEAVGKKPNILKSGKHPREIYKGLWDTITAGDVWHGELINRKKNGELYYEEVTISPIKDGSGKITNFVSMKNDVTARKKAEEELERKTLELARSALNERSYAEVMELFSSTYDDMRIFKGMLSLLANRQKFPASVLYLYDDWTGALKCAASHGAPEKIKTEFALGEGVIGQAAVDMKEVIVEGGESGTHMTIETGIASFVPAAIAINPVVFQGRTLGVLVLASAGPLMEADKNFIKRLSEQLGVALNGLKQYNNLKELSNQLQLKGDEIARKNLLLEESNRLKSEFLANMSHELRTPLNAIIGFSEVLKNGMVGDLPADQKKYIVDIFNSGMHLLSLINDILDLSKIEAGKMTLDTEMMQIGPALEGSLSIVKEKAFSNDIKLDLVLEEGIGVISVDPRKFKQIVYNLLSNAVKFTQKGGSVSITAGRGRGKDGDCLAVSVTDTGIGISGDDIEKLFKPFEQLDGSMSRRFEGTGLGLVMVKKLVELHGGAVGVTSEAGKGSCFTFTIPYGKEGEAGGVKKAEPRPMPPRSIESPLVLVIEDDDRSADLLRQQLVSDGYRTIRASTAEEGLRTAASQHPDLITLDIMLPGMSGWDFLTEIKKMRELSHIPVVIVSIVSDSGKGFSLGAAKVLQKPLQKDGLITALEELGFSALGCIGPCKILVVDDDAKAVDMVSRLVEHIGFTPLRAYGGRQAINMSRSERPDLVILDLMMPEVNGFDVVQSLKASPETRLIPVIILTAKILTEEDKNTLNGDVLKIIQKGGFMEEDFILEVKRALWKGSSRKGAGKSIELTPGVAPLETKPAWETTASESKDGRLVLIVEDNPMDSALLSLYLRDEGFRVKQAANGKEALKMMRAEKPAVITLDLMMPMMDGFTFLTEKSQYKEFANIPVLIISGTLDGEKGASLGAHAVLKKPIQRSELLGAVSTICLNSDPKKPLKVLLIDDDHSAVKIMSRYFEKEKFEVLMAYGGAEGIMLAVQKRPDVIITDLMMPEVSGIDVIDSLKKNEVTRDIPIVILTAKVLSGEEKHALAEKVKNIVDKGRFQRDAFINEIKILLKCR